ncbi:PTS lactose/cellobiose transporter subunit IIA [Paraliobacillus sp. JSM ZJ581]|uniref:PTS lactose/cellobiose transporter subunit IIA n=1 Tax=Paraliobacillus sp. JSM ZJ581 TaxID=3342118 RepID=UPI0035A84AEE
MENETNRMLETAMKIILAAGNAREQIQSAMVGMGAFDFAAVEEHLAQAKEYISEAHTAQTETIQGEARGEVIPFSLLFTHAQDHLMTVISEHQTAKNLLTVFRSLDQRISELENK